MRVQVIDVCQSGCGSEDVVRDLLVVTGSITTAAPSGRALLMRLEHAAQVRHRQPGKAGTSATASDTHARLINPARKCFGHTGRGTGTALVTVGLGLGRDCPSRT